MSDVTNTNTVAATSGGTDAEEQECMVAAIGLLEEHQRGWHRVTKAQEDQMKKNGDKHPDYVSVAGGHVYPETEPDEGTEMQTNRGETWAHVRRCTNPVVHSMDHMPGRKEVTGTRRSKVREETTNISPRKEEVASHSDISASDDDEDIESNNETEAGVGFTDEIEAEANSVGKEIASDENLPADGAGAIVDVPAPTGPNATVNSDLNVLNSDREDPLRQLLRKRHSLQNMSFRDSAYRFSRYYLGSPVQWLVQYPIQPVMQHSVYPPCRPADQQGVQAVQPPVQPPVHDQTQIEPNPFTISRPNQEHEEELYLFGLAEAAATEEEEETEQNSFGPMKNGTWEDDEKTRLTKGVSQYGHAWSDVSRIVSTRTAGQCKSMHHKMQKEAANAENISTTAGTNAHAKRKKRRHCSVGDCGKQEQGQAYNHMCKRHFTETQKI